MFSLSWIKALPPQLLLMEVHGIFLLFPYQWVRIPQCKVHLQNFSNEVAPNFLLDLNIVSNEDDHLDLDEQPRLEVDW